MTGFVLNQEHTELVLDSFTHQSFMPDTVSVPSNEKVIRKFDVGLALLSVKAVTTGPVWSSVTVNDEIAVFILLRLSLAHAYAVFNPSPPERV